MESLEEKLKRIIARALEGEADLETMPDDHVCGHVVSPLFADKDYHDRRMLIKEAVKRSVASGELTAEEQGRISILLTYTPAEWSVVLTDTTD